jgi:hypothetical protein
MEKRTLIWSIVILAFLILVVWAIIVIIDSWPSEPAGPPGVIITDGGGIEGGDDVDALGSENNDVDSVIDDEISDEGDDLDLGDVI